MISDNYTRTQLPFH